MYEGYHEGYQERRVNSMGSYVYIYIYIDIDIDRYIYIPLEADTCKGVLPTLLTLLTGMLSHLNTTLRTSMLLLSHIV